MDTSDPLHRLTLDLLYPPFLSRLRLALEECEDLGATYVGHQGYRSLLAQQTLNTKLQAGPGRKKAGAAPAGYSAHNYGLAVDFMRLFDDVESWATQDYETLGEACERQGLVWGHRFHNLDDADHIQWPGFVSGKELEPLRAIFLQTSSLADVWAYVTSHSPTFPNQVTPKGSTT